MRCPQRLRLFATAARFCVFLLVLSHFAFAELVLPPEKETYQALRQVLKGQGDRLVRKIAKKGQRTIVFEAMISQEGDFKLAPFILGNLRNYGRWALKDVNKKAGGGSYYLQIRDLKVDPLESVVLHTDCYFSTPVYHKEMQRDFRMRFSQGEKVFTLAGEALPNADSPVASADGFMRIYPAEALPNRVWIYIQGEAVLRSWLLYEALPERVMGSETGERIQTILDNYLAEEDRVRVIKEKR